MRTVLKHAGDRGNTYNKQPDGTWHNPTTDAVLSADYRFIKLGRGGM